MSRRRAPTDHSGMTTDTAAPDPGHAGYDAPPRRLYRSRDDRLLAGVCAGLGRYTDVDPVLFRVTLAVLTAFGGVGLLLYGVGWLFIPEEGKDSPVESLLRRWHGRSALVT